MNALIRKVPWLTRFSVEKPRLVMTLILAVTLLFLTQIPRAKTDTDPKNMLPENSPVRVYNDVVEREFSLHKDVIVLGIVNDDGIFNQGTLGRVAQITNEKLGGTSLAYLAGVSSVPDFWKGPEALRYLESLQKDLEGLAVVGKTFSVADYVKRINRVLHQDSPAYDRIPDSQAENAQYLFLFGMAAKPSDLDNVVDYPFEKVNLSVQLKTWDAPGDAGCHRPHPGLHRRTPLSRGGI